MKTLIIHPADPTTNFLCSLYLDLPNKSVITGYTTKSELWKKLAECDQEDRLIFCGYGSPLGLFGLAQFPADNGFIIDESMVESLVIKSNVLYIWCNADKFVQRHSLTGFNTGMFISELSESQYYRFYHVKQ